MKRLGFTCFQTDRKQNERKMVRHQAVKVQFQNKMSIPPFGVSEWEGIQRFRSPTQTWSDKESSNQPKIYGPYRNCWGKDGIHFCGDSWESHDHCGRRWLGGSGLSLAPQQTQDVGLRHTRIPPSCETKVEHRGDETPADDELSGLKHRLQPLLGLFAELRHGS